MAEVPREVATADHVETFLCTLDGVDHDWRPHRYLQFNRPHTSWRCVWCHAVACGDYDEPDPCWLPYHHDSGHRSRNGVTWALGTSRPADGGEQ